MDAKGSGTWGAGLVKARLSAVLDANSWQLELEQAPALARPRYMARARLGRPLPLPGGAEQRHGLEADPPRRMLRVGRDPGGMSSVS